MAQGNCKQKIIADGPIYAALAGDAWFGLCFEAVCGQNEGERGLGGGFEELAQQQRFLEFFPCSMKRALGEGLTKSVSQPEKGVIHATELLSFMTRSVEQGESLC